MKWLAGSVSHHAVYCTNIYERAATFPLPSNARLHTELNQELKPHHCSCNHKLRLNYKGEEAEVKAHPQAQRGTRKHIDLEHGAGHRCTGTKILVTHALT